MPLLINRLITQNTSKMRRGRPLLSLPPSCLEPVLPSFSPAYFCISFNSILSSLLFLFSLISSFFSLQFSLPCSASSPPVSSHLPLSLYMVFLWFLSFSIFSFCFPYLLSLYLHMTSKIFPCLMAPAAIFHKGGQNGPLNMLRWHTDQKSLLNFKNSIVLL